MIVELLGQVLVLVFFFLAFVVALLVDVVAVVVLQDVLVQTLAFAQPLLVVGLLLREVVEQDLFVDYVLQLLAVQVVLLELELDRRDRLTAGLR